jgi:transposase
MPWKERSIVEERMRFVLRLKDGECMSSLCREFGISRVTGYKIYERYKECGLEGLTDRARTPYRYANTGENRAPQLIYFHLLIPHFDKS